jgi:hypothetical protein
VWRLIGVGRIPKKGLRGFEEMNDSVMIDFAYGEDGGRFVF